MDLAVDLAGRKQLLVRTHGNGFSVFHHDNAVRVANRGGALGYDKGCGVIGQCRDRPAKRRICCVVKRRGTVIKDQDLRAAAKRARNGKALLLSSREVACVLLQHKVKPPVLFLYKLPCLCSLKRRAAILIRGIFVAKQEIVPYRPRKQLGLLGYNADLFA